MLASTAAQAEVGRARSRCRALRPALPSGVLRRSAWAIVALSHAPALVGAWSKWVAGGFDPAPFGGCVAITLATLFFFLKVVDLPCLRLRTDRRAWVAIILVVGLVHVDALRPGHLSAAIPEYALAAATTLLALGFSRIHRLAKEIQRRVQSWRPPAPLTHSREIAWLDAFHPHCWVLTLRTFALRAPPA